MKVLTILGTSASLFKDIETHGVRGDVLAVNHAVQDYSGHIKYAVSLHKKELEEFIANRKLNGYNTEDVISFTDEHPCAATINTSGLFALQLSQLLAYDEVRVLGISADSSGHYYDQPTAAIQHEDFTAKFPFDNDEWLPILNTWSNIKVASGNLLRLFKSL